MGARVDVIILGGGIAGLWLLDVLYRAGFSAAVLNKGDLGQGQSIAAQGIIHGGAKYFGDAPVSDLAPMPARWRASLTGKNAPDLRAAPPLADAMQMWLPPQLGGGLMALLAKKSMLREMRERGPGERLSVLPQGPGGTLFDVDEAVIDVPKVLAALQELHCERVFGLPVGGEVSFTERRDGGIDIAVGAIDIQAQRIVLTAGSGNEELLSRAGLNKIRCQRRPLHQIIIRGMTLPLYLHCIGKNPKPLATITSHPDHRGGYYWYVGGLLAEQGVGQGREQLITTAKTELSRLLPGADFSNAEWATHAVDRAEPGAGGGRGGLRPSAAVALARGAVIAGWPAKLALAPVLAEKVMGLLAADGVRPLPHDPSGLNALPKPIVARPPWEMVTKWI
jgi:glycine/D-amino acid oxidase-like deaminating enzyme